MKKISLLLTFFMFVLVVVSCDTECGSDNNGETATKTTTTNPPLTFTITYNNTLGATNSNQMTFKTNENVTLSDISLNNLKFVGWYDATPDGNKVTGWKAGEKMNEVKLWARWKDTFIEDQSGDFVIKGVRMQKSSLVTVLSGTNVIPCGLSNGAFALPRKNMTLSAFAIGKYEVTQELFETVMGTNPSYYKESTKVLDTSDGRSETNAMLRPVEKVSWFAAIAFCNKLSLLMGKTLYYSIKGISDWSKLSYSEIPTYEDADWTEVTCDFYANGYRLPTEAEWECAARGGVYGTTPWWYTFSGSETIGDVAWYSENSSSHTWEVGLKQPNSLGIYDMSGNVLEFCWDWYGDITDDVVINPVGPSKGDYRVTRGGCIYENIESCSVFTRTSKSIIYTNSFIGFRIAENK